jgi:hypothetical protein
MKIVRIKEKTIGGTQKGITLIALIITIIVMLILARSNNSDNDKWRSFWASRKSKDRNY